MYNSIQPPVQPSEKPKHKTKAGTIIPVVIIIGCIVGAMYFSGVFDSLFVLGPARDIVGTWETAIPIKFNIQMDGENAGYEYRDMTWKITATNDQNIVEIEITWTASNKSIISGLGYTPDVQPMILQGTISGTSLALNAPTDQFMTEYKEDIGEFTFTTSQMEGTWHDHWEIVYEQNVYTATNDLKLLKQ